MKNDKIKGNKVIKLSEEDEEAILDSLRIYMRDEFDVDIGNMPAKFLLDFMLALIGPKIYDQAIHDIEPWLYERFTGILEDIYALKKE